MLNRMHTSLAKVLRFWSVWAAVGFPILLVGIEATPLAPDFAYVLIGLPALLLVWACLGLWAAIIAIRRLAHRDWQRAVISAVLPLVVLGAGLHFWAFIHACGIAGNAVHFYVRYPSYMKAVRATPTNGEPRLITFNLGGMSWASQGFVYDESDEIMRGPSMRSPHWTARSQNSELSCGYGAVPMPGPYTFAKHWYIAWFPC
jgi:hypothetical protein